MTHAPAANDQRDDEDPDWTKHDYSAILTGSTHAKAMLAQDAEAADFSRDDLLTQWNNPAERPGMVSRAAAFYGYLSFFAATVGEWVRFLVADHPDASARRFALAEFIVKGDDNFEGDESEATAKLQTELVRRLAQLAEHLNPLPAPAQLRPVDGLSLLVARQVEEPPWRDGALSFDLAFADFLETVGKSGKGSGKEAAQICRRQARERADNYLALVRERPGLAHLTETNVRREAPERAAAQGDLFALWTPAGKAKAPVWAAWLTDCLWVDWVRPLLKHKQEKGPAAWTRAIHAPITELLSMNAQREVGPDGQLALRLPNAAIVRAIHTDAIAAPYLENGSGLDIFRTITAHRLVRYVSFVAHDRLFDPNCPDFRVLHYPGAYGTLAKAMGIEGNYGAEKVREAVEVMHCMDVTIEGTTTRLLNRSFTGGVGQRDAHLSIVVGLGLLPDYGYELSQSKALEARRARDLIPLMPIPPLTGRANEAGAQATASMRVVCHFRDHAIEMVERGGAPLPFDVFARLCDASGLPRKMVADVLAVWLTGKGDAPAFLKKVDPDRYTLSDAYPAERAFLEQGGQDSIDAQRHGRAGVAARQAARAKGRPKAK